MENPLKSRRSTTKKSPPATIDQIGVLADLTSSRAWGAIVTLAIVIVGVFIWSVFGVIYTRVAGLGVTLPVDGNVEQVLSEGSGPVSRVAVSLGQHVAKGDTIAIIDQAVLTDQLSSAEKNLQIAQSQRTKRAENIAADLKAKEAFTNEQISTLNDKIASLTSLIAFRSQYLSSLTREEGRGYATKIAVQQAQSDFSSSQIDLGTTKGQIAETRNQLAEAKASGAQELQQLDANIQQLEENVTTLKVQLSLSGQVTAPATGRIVDIATAPGSVLSVGQIVATIAPDTNGVEVVSYFQVGDGKRILPGDNVLVSFDSVDPDLYGTASGTVTSVGAVPETPTSLLNTLGNQTLVQQLAPDFAPLQVRVKLQEDPKEPGSYLFSSGRQPPFKITTDTTAGVLVLVSQDRPITYVLPIMRDLLGP
tara:strand:- start:780 stop:2042 length:1263 start_codon:yes stop_codon:yes gene_type:complete